MGHSRSIRYRRSPHLVFYWRGSKLVIHNYATRTRAGAEPVVCEIVHFFDRWRSAEELFAFKAPVSRRVLRKLLVGLVRRSIVQRDDRPLVESEGTMASWADWNPAAGFFHNSTKDLEYADLKTIDRLTREKARETPMPDPVKRYDGAKVHRLPPMTVGGEFPTVLLARRTWRRFARRPVDLAQFSTLLGLTGGVQSWVRGSENQKVALKTSPSGGARHPIELYTLVLRVKGLTPGLYHYASERHALELIDATVKARGVERYLPTQWWYRDASAIVFFAAVFAREQWRYAHARAYRAVLIEAGHLCQTFCLTATWLGLAPFCSMALADARIEHDLGLDGVSESVLYAAGVGTQAPGVGWTPPDARRGNPTVLKPQQVRKVPGRIVGATR